MRDFVIVNKEDATKKATLRVDMVEDKIEKLTIMWCDGVRDTEFEKIIPWKCGTVTSMTEIEEWAAQYQSEYDVYMYGGEQVKKLGAETFKLTLTANITGGSTCEVNLEGTKDGASPIEDKVTLNNGEPKELEIISGWEYKLTLTSGNLNSGDPGTWTADADKIVTLGVSFES